MKTDNTLKSKILRLLQSPKYQPLDKVELSKKLDIPSERRSELRELLREMEQCGEIARIRKERYVIPQTADLFTGILQVHRSGSAHLLSEKKGSADLFISAENTGTAMNGDRVVARLLREGVEEVRRRVRGEKPSAQTGSVIRILERANMNIVGTLQQSKNFFYVIPDDSHMVHNIYVRPVAVGQREGEPLRQAQDLRRPREPFLERGVSSAIPRVGDKVVVKLDAWESRHVNPEGEIIEVLGPASAPGVDMLSIIRKNNLPVEFPATVLREADRIKEEIQESELARREDLRGQMIVTIDPDDAKDFDDAINVEKHAGGWSLGVHIADVSHYVTPGGVLDREAFKRGNSVYLADRVIPMLPEKLSNGICSLKPNVDRLTRSAFIEFTPDGKIKSARFAHTVIRSAARLTYKQAFTILNGGAPAGKKDAETRRQGDAERGRGRLGDLETRRRGDSPCLPVSLSPSIPPSLSPCLLKAWELASILRKNRFAAGSLDLDFPEVKVWLDELGRPVKLEKIENDISHQLIEEFMLAANEVVAHSIKNRKLPSIYRIHEEPDPDRLVEYRELAGSYGFKAGDLTNRREVQKLLASFKGREEEYALKLGFLKSLKRATYDIRPLGHYGLAKVNYTHFTSPIRRYADLVVHRVLANAGQFPRPQNEETRAAGGRLSAADLPAVAEHVSKTERVAADAEKESVKLKKLEFFLNQLRLKRLEEYHAVVIDVRSYGLLVELPDVLVTGMVSVSSMTDDFYVFDAARMRFTGRRLKKTFQLGDKLKVSVAKVDAYKQQMDFFIINCLGR